MADPCATMLQQRMGEVREEKRSEAADPASYLVTVSMAREQSTGLQDSGHEAADMWYEYLEFAAARASVSPARTAAMHGGMQCTKCVSLAECEPRRATV